MFMKSIYLIIKVATAVIKCAQSNVKFLSISYQT